MSTSNLTQFIDRFFDELEIYEDKERGHQYKPYLRQSITRFLGQETQDNAFAVYRAFFDSYRVAIEGSSNPFVDIIDVLRQYEATAATLIDKQRDHFIHSVNVFLTGLSIYAQNSRYRDAFLHAVPEPEYQNAYTTKHEEFFYRWGLAALFHDIGYPVEIAGNQLNRFLRIITSADGGETRVRAKLSYENFDELNRIEEIVPKRAFTKTYYDAYESCSYIDLLKPLDLMAHRIHLSLGTDLEQTKAALNGSVENMAKIGFIDHGYFSALIVLKWYGYLIQKCDYCPEYLYWPVVDSATAILLHNWYKNGLQKPPFNLPPLSPEKNPIAFLLILCDELQEWNREAKGIVTRTFTLAESVNISLEDGYLGVTYVTRNGLLPGDFCREKEELFRTLIAGETIFPKGIDVDNTSLGGLSGLKERLGERTSRPLFEQVERLAIAIHARYNEKQMEDHPDKPLAYPKFSDLPDDMKYSNLRQAQGIYEKLALAGYTLAPAGQPGELGELPADVLESLAEKEHEAWVEERLSSGWTLGEKDVANKKSPYLIPYDQLTEEIKDYDRDTIRNIPRLAKLIGMSIYEC